MKMGNKKTLEEKSKVAKNLLDQLNHLPTDKAKAKLIRELLYKKVNIPKQHLINAIEYYKKQNEIKDAANIAYNGGLIKIAQQLYQEAMEKYGKRGDYYKAAQMAKFLELKKEALHYFRKEGGTSLENALDVAFELESSEEIQKSMWDLMEYYHSRAYNENGPRMRLGGDPSFLFNYEDTAAIYYDLAAGLAKKLELTEKAQVLYNNAIKVYRLAGKFENAIETVNKKGLTKKEKEKEIQEICEDALKIYEKNGMFEEAAEMAKKLNLTDKANHYGNLVNELEKLERF